MKKRILLICDANLPRAPRVNNTFLALREQFDFIMAGYEKPSYDVDFIELPRVSNKKRNYTFHHGLPTILRKPISVLVKMWIAILNIFHPPKNKNKIFFELLKDQQFDLIINHHMSTLEAAIELKKLHGKPLIVNLHEYYPREFEEVEGWMEREGIEKKKLCAKLLPEADQLFIVSEGITKEYKKEFGVSGITIRNDKPHNSHPPHFNEGDSIRLIHHGGAIRGREIEEMIKAVQDLDRVSLDLMLMETDPIYYQELSKIIDGIDNVRLVSPVGMSEIIGEISKYDAGIYRLNVTGFNFEMALPNKLFEYIQAKLAIVITPNPEMKRIVEAYDLGIVSPSFSLEDFKNSIGQLNRSKVTHFKEQCEKHAHELSSEVTQKRIFEEVSTVLKNHN